MVDDFKFRHRGGKCDRELLAKLKQAKLTLFSLYARYSCDNSDPKSILDQCTNCLRDAAARKVFVPWQYVYCDYSISGLDSSRLGYSSYKRVLEDTEEFVSGTLIDDFTRACRDELEWWKLAAMSKRLGKGLFGVSDKFDLNSAHADILMFAYGLLSRLFIKGLREKVVRGMKGGARRFTCLGKQPLGFTRRILRDESGSVVRRQDGRPRHQPCWDPDTQNAAVMLFKLFYVKCKSPYRITQIFNRLKVEGWDRWTQKGIVELLHNPAYIGVFIWNKYRKEFNPETMKWEKKLNPHSEWEVYYNKHLALIPMEWWRGTQRKFAAMKGSKRSSSKLSRNQVSANTLFSGTLFCDYCKAELKLVRSASSGKSLGCLHGVARSCGCKLTSSKSTKIIETCLLQFLKDVILTDAAVSNLVDRTNAYIQEEETKPLVNVAPLKADARKIKEKIAKLVRFTEDEDDEELCSGYKNRVKELQRALIAKNAEIRDAVAQKAVRLAPLDADRVKLLLSDLRGLLNQDVPVAAQAIRAITGPIKIRQQKIKGRKRGASWIATFSPNLPSALAQLAREKDIPDSITLEILSKRIWNHRELVEVKIQHRYEELCEKIAEMAKTHSQRVCAAALGVSLSTVDAALRTAKGKLPRKRVSGGGSRRGKGLNFRAILSEVVRCHDELGQSFAQIAQDLGVSKPMVYRAYQEAHPELVRAAIEHERPLHHGAGARLGMNRLTKVKEMISANEPTKKIMSAVGCSKQTVGRIRNEMLLQMG